MKQFYFLSMLLCCAATPALGMNAKKEAGKESDEKQQLACPEIQKIERRLSAMEKAIGLLASKSAATASASSSTDDDLDYLNMGHMRRKEAEFRERLKKKEDAKPKASLWPKGNGYTS